ncbi:MAG: GTP-binding protein [Nocardioides sp.]
MQRRRLNLGILAHVDAGKTTLTERLLLAGGVIDDVGSVDAGTTQTDSLALERRRGITIKSAVAAFPRGDTTVNLLDTPGHPDFIAEVERVLGVLDGAILVVSAVEGVQPQTRVLMRALRRLRVPTLIFVNKIDRTGAQPEAVLEALRRRVAPAIVPVVRPLDAGTRAAQAVDRAADDEGFRAELTEVLADRDEDILAEFVDHASGVPYHHLREALVAQTAAAEVHPVFFGAAITGVGVDALRRGIAELLPQTTGDANGPVAGRVFKIERVAGRPVAFVRMFSGTLHPRDRVPFGNGGEGRVTGVEVFERGAVTCAGPLQAGAIGKLWGLGGVRIGDAVGEVHTRAVHQFAPPGLKAAIVAVHASDSGRLRVALNQLAEQDPLIDVRQDPENTSVSLYGEIQKEVIAATLAEDFDIPVEFHETTPICIERLRGPGEAAEVLRASTPTNVVGRSSPTSANPFVATLGLRVQPAAVDSGVRVRLDTEARLVPTYVYGTTDNFLALMEQYVRQSLTRGLHGWQVTDCLVTILESGYRSPESTAADFRKLTPRVLIRALERAGTVVCEPMSRTLVESPTDTVGQVVGAVSRLHGVVRGTTRQGELSVVDAVVPTVRVNDLQRRLPGLTSGEGTLEASPAGHRPTRGMKVSRG